MALICDINRCPHGYAVRVYAGSLEVELCRRGFVVFGGH
jgi:hypothetical protein